MTNKFASSGEAALTEGRLALTSNPFGPLRGPSFFLAVNYDGGIMSRPLELYLGDDNQIWALDKALGVGYRMVPSDQRNQHPPAPPSDSGAGIAEAPTDGNLYARQNGAWVLVLPPATWLSAALDGAWTGAIYCRMGAYGHAVQLYGTPSFATGSLATGAWTRLAVLPNTMWPSVATAFLAPSQHTNNTPDYAYVYVDTNGVLSVMPSTNKVNQVLIDFTITLS